MRDSFPYRCRPSTTMHRTHNRRTTRSSLVPDLIDRSVTGRMPPVETHIHADSVFLALWNKKNFKGCFQNYIVRSTIDRETTVQLGRCMKCFGRPKFCKFGQVFINNCYIKRHAFKQKQYEHFLHSQSARCFGKHMSVPGNRTLRRDGRRIYHHVLLNTFRRHNCRAGVLACRRKFKRRHLVMAGMFLQTRVTLYATGCFI
jgi:hypothetical protein